MPGNTSTSVSWGEKLNSGEDIEVLSELRTHLWVSAVEQKKAAIDSLQLTQIFQYLDSKDDEQVKITCEVLTLCFKNLPVDRVVKETADYIVNWLGHRDSTVRKMAIAEILREIKRNRNIYLLPDNLHIALAVTKCICDDDLNIASDAGEIVATKDWIQHPQIINEMNVILETANNSNRCKCFEVVSNTVKNFPDRLRDQTIQGYLLKLIAEFDTTDVLYKLNVMEILSNVALVPNGLDFIIENNVLKQLSDMAETINENPVGKFFIPGLIKFFGTIAHKYPTEICNNYPVIVDLLFETLNNGFLRNGLDTLGFIGSTIEGKLALGSLGRVFISSISKIGDVLKNSPDYTKIRALNCVQNLIDVKHEDGDLVQVDRRVTLMTREWFRQLSEKPTSIEVIFELGKHPFPDIRVNALKVLAAICNHRWGQELILNTAGMIEYLLNRYIEQYAECKYIKYGIMTTLSKSDVFDPATSERFKTYQQQGPFYVPGAVEVITEDY